MNRVCLMLSIVLLLFCGDQTVGIPDLIFPINGEQVDLPLTFVWSLVENCGGYRIEVDTTLTFSSPLIFVDEADTTYTTSNLTSGTYYWRVAAYDSDNRIGEFAYPHNFDVIAVGSPPRDLSVAATNNGLSVDLSWVEPTAGQPDNYIIYFKEVGTTEWIVNATLGGNVLSYIHDPLEATGDYFVAADWDGTEYNSEIETTIPVHTVEMTIYELESSGNGG